MGCDIHLHVEKRGPNGWERVLPPEGWNCTTLDFSPFENRWDDGSKYGWYWDRDYDLFAWLAGVRNYAGCSPLSEPRGLPADASAEVKADSDELGIDGHTHSWLALSEFEAAAATNVNTRNGDGPASEVHRRFYALVNAMRGIVGADARIVFWFDN